LLKVANQKDQIPSSPSLDPPVMLDVVVFALAIKAQRALSGDAGTAGNGKTSIKTTRA
jgi:hypothetical protein